MNRISKVLEHLDDVSVVQIYSNIIYEIINNCNIKWLKEFYSESPNWLMNWNIQINDEQLNGVKTDRKKT